MTNGVLRTAILIDGENVSPTTIPGLIGRLGVVWTEADVRRVYADWRVGATGWHAACRCYGLQEIQQLALVAGKNATDIAIVVDAMDLVAHGFEKIVVVSSDSDFSPLAYRLRERGVAYVGVGGEKTSGAYRSCCKDFLLLPETSRATPQVVQVAPVAPSVPASKPQSVPNKLDKEDEKDVRLLERINEKFHEPDGFTPGSNIGNLAAKLGSIWGSTRPPGRKLSSILDRHTDIFEKQLRGSMIFFRVRAKRRS